MSVNSYQGAAAKALAGLCSDTTIIDAVVEEQGLWSVITMAQSPHLDVQRHAARAFWHLAVQHEDKRKVHSLPGGHTQFRS